jgi:hypothetical protein
MQRRMRRRRRRRIKMWSSEEGPEIAWLRIYSSKNSLKRAVEYSASWLPECLHQQLFRKDGQ